ncbi:MAG TPA: MoaD/ThiS family protein [Chloroflexota bacterium]|nr:MoaD/ThiS family protein [Chloroflexota bacterium]
MTAPGTITVRVLLFASFREIAGQSELRVAIQAGTTVESVLGSLESKYPELAALRQCTTFAVNRQIVGGSTTLRDGDELAFLQPVAGGAGD